ncbi:tyrosine-type recombinase/integrase [Rheinheimera muenzenbergensis]|uniref:Tyrosine-type recombinase/integrase n=1 Tax=Rheinheimera muenzenbergensis TaxID=1193628 RepID=A0ABU8C3V3_9GAMM
MKILPSTFPFTQKKISDVLPECKTRRYTDKHLSNLKLVVTPKGSKTYYAMYKVAGQARSVKVGFANEVSLTDARARVVELVNSEKEKRHRTFLPPDLKKLQTLERLSGFTVQDAYRAYYENHLKHRKTSGNRQHALHHTYTNYLQQILGKLDITELNRKWLAKCLKNIFLAKGYTIHNKCVTVLKAMFNYCLVYEDNYALEFNPASLLKKETGVVRSRYLSMPEIVNLLTELNALNHPVFTDLFKMALFTGARIGNVKSMRWDEIDFNNATWIVPAIKTKTNKTYHLPLTAQAIEILGNRYDQRSESPFVFPSNRSASGHVMGGDAIWKKVITSAGLYSKNKDIRIRKHDLRRTFASLQALKGVDINTISKTLGHTDIKHTQIYAQIDSIKSKAAIDLAFGDLPLNCK